VISRFPDFTPLNLELQAELKAYLKANPPLGSEYTFTNLFGWQRSADYQAARFGDGFLLRRSHRSGRETLLEPLVTRGGLEALEAGFDYLAGRGRMAEAERVTESFLERFPAVAEKFRVVEDRDNHDYLYLVRELIDLAGEKFHDKQNLYRQFVRKYRFSYRPMTGADIQAGLDFVDHWCRKRECDKYEGLNQEKRAVRRMLKNFETLGLRGGLLEIEGNPVALTLGEPLNPETYVIHVEKADSAYTGVYQAINREFLKEAAAGFRFVNREQDMGLLGLRQAKLSYNPVRLVRKYRLFPAGAQAGQLGGS